MKCILKRPTFEGFAEARLIHEHFSHVDGCADGRGRHGRFHRRLSCVVSLDSCSFLCGDDALFRVIGRSNLALGGGLWSNGSPTHGTHTQRTLANQLLTSPSCQQKRTVIILVSGHPLQPTNFKQIALAGIARGGQHQGSSGRDLGDAG